jgi:dTDP-4-dehydrorhamnose reductase
VQLSTDYVFPGGAPPPDPSAPTGPLNVYGRHKLAAETVVLTATADNLVIRTATLLDFLGRRNVFQPIYEPLRNGQEISCLTDQASNPLASALAAGLVLALVEKNARGIFHIGGREVVSRYELALQMAAYFGFDRNLVQPATSASVSRAAARPSRAGLDCRATESVLDAAMPTLEESFAIIARDIKASA